MGIVRIVFTVNYRFAFSRRFNEVISFEYLGFFYKRDLIRNLLRTVRYSY